MGQGSGAPAETTYAVGVNWSYYTGGLSGMMNLTDEVRAQAVLGFFAGDISIEGRGLYDFHQEDFWNLYGHAGLGYYSYSNVLDDTESAIGFGAGAGFEYDWRALSENLPPIFASFELGFSLIEFESHNAGGLFFGGGIHYRF